ncbi:MAG: hypothetical protein ACRD63_12610, partial [Pyrinomonadaceae bacterium]
MSTNFKASDTSATQQSSWLLSGQSIQPAAVIVPQAIGAASPSRLTETTDAAGSTATTYTLAIGKTAQGQVSTTGDHDWFKVNLVAGQTYTFAMVATGVTTVRLDDTYLVLR